MTSRRALQKYLFKMSAIAALITVAVGAAIAPRWGLAQSTVPTRNTPISLAVRPGEPNWVIVGTLNAPDPANIYRSEDGGVSWVDASLGAEPNISVAGLAFDPNDEDFIMAGDGGFGYLYRSDDAGASWEEIPEFRTLLAPNSAVGEVYATRENRRSIFYVTTRYDAVYRTPDRGDTWEHLEAGLEGEARRVREVADYGGIMYAGTHDGLYRLDENDLWTPVTTFPIATIIFSLLVDDETLYAGTASGLYRSDDGQEWARVANFPDTLVYDIISTGGRVVAATDQGIIAGLGEAWESALLNGEAYGETVYAVANLPEAPRTIYAATDTMWVVRSDDEGGAFSSLLQMPPLDVRAALATPTPTPTNTATPTSTPTPTNTPTATPTYTPTPTATFSPTPTATATPTNTPTATPVPTETPTRTPQPTQSPTPTPQVIPLVGLDAGVTETLGITDTLSFTAPLELMTLEPDAALTSTLALTLPTSITASVPITPGESGAAEDLPAAPPDTIAIAVPTAESSVPTVTPEPPTPTPTNTAPPTPTPVATETPVATATAIATSTPAPPTATPTITPTPTSTPVPIDLAAELYARLPPVFVGAGLLLFFVILGAGASIVRGPRDI